MNWLYDPLLAGGEQQQEQVDGPGERPGIGGGVGLGSKAGRPDRRDRRLKRKG